jgi:hypothetical protein
MGSNEKNQRPKISCYHTFKQNNLNSNNDKIIFLKLNNLFAHKYLWIMHYMIENMLFIMYNLVFAITAEGGPWR